LIVNTSHINSPTAAGRTTRRFRFVFSDGRRRGVSVKRREAVHEHVTGWAGARIVREEQHGTECIVIVEAARPVPVAVVEKFVRECPHYVRDTFAACG
jgi:hypothetical protein